MASPLRYHGYWLLGFREICTVTLGTEAQTFGTEAQKKPRRHRRGFLFQSILVSNIKAQESIVSPTQNRIATGSF